MNTIVPQLTTFTVVSCYSCATQFGMDDALRKRRRSDGQSFWCPNGHEQHYTETDATRLQNAQRRLERAEARATHAQDQREAAERSARAYKGVATRVKRRAAHGVCPCCSRTFADIARHVAGQHPEFVAEHGAAHPDGTDA